MTVSTVALGRGGPPVSRVGLGLMAMSGVYGPADRAESIATIHAALDAGITLLDTGDFYGMGHNELLLAEALRGVDRDSVFIQVKFGGQRDPGGAFVGYDASPRAVKNFLAYSLTRLGTDHIDLYQPARLDPRVPIEETVGAIAEMIQAGYVRYLGLSEMGAETIRRAQSVYPVSGLQIEYSLMSRGIEESILPVVRELGISVTAYGILSRGLLSAGARELAGNDPRSRFPRFQGENLRRNLDLLTALEQIAAEHGATVPQLAFAWALSRGEDIIPLIGTKRRARLAEALGALDLRLSPDELARLEAAVPPGQVAGDRYDAAQMQALDSERGVEPARGDNSKTRGDNSKKRQRGPRSMITERFAAQLLTGPPARGPEEVTGRLLAVQAQDPRGARLAIRPRSAGLTAADVDRALTDGTLLISWLNRGTLHLVRREDYGWLHALTTPPLRVANARRLDQEGVTPEAADRAVAVIESSLAEEGPLTRPQLRDRIAAAGVRTEGQALVHELMLACLRGIAVRGPMAGRDHAYVLVRDWLEPPRPFDRSQALAELARRFLAGHGPADERDLAKWAGIPLRDARSGLTAIAGELIQRDDGLADLAALAGQRDHGLPPPRLLGSFDPLLHGWVSREPILGQHTGIITVNGLFRPFALVEGRAVATWTLPDGVVELNRLAEVSAAAEEALAADAADVRRFLGL